MKRTAELPAVPAEVELPTSIGQIRTGVSREQVIKAGAFNPGPGLRSFTAPIPQAPPVEPEPEEPGPVPVPPLPPTPEPNEPVSPPAPEPPPAPSPEPEPAVEPAPAPATPAVPPSPALPPQPTLPPQPGLPQLSMDGARGGSRGSSGSSRGGLGPVQVRNLLLGIAGLLIVVLLVLVVVMTRAGGDGDATANGVPSPSATQAAPTELEASIRSFDPIGGSGFTKKADGWETQRYNSATFGNLKDGVGLVLDLGSAKSVSAVSFDAGTGPLTVELRAGDTAGGSEDYATVSESGSASGKTTLKGTDGGKHQYWMIWVTRLGTGNRAEISDITVSGS